ncbi:hypothetical protein TcG_05393 [Trypanosoma cruzi]|nr:hypothetical protein TcG_05393 [Trypanosoma cruzi]
MSKASFPRIFTNREARWGSALAVFGATDQSKIKVPSGSGVKLLGVKVAISDQRLAVIHASRKTTRSFQSVRPRIYRFVSSSVRGRVCCPYRARARFPPTPRERAPSWERAKRALARSRLVGGAASGRPVSSKAAGRAWALPCRGAGTAAQTRWGPIPPPCWGPSQYLPRAYGNPRRL